MPNESKKTKFEQTYAHARNLVNSFNDISKLSNLFKEAVAAETYLTNYQKNIEKESNNLNAVTKAVEDMDLVYGKRVKKLREMEEQTKQKVINMEAQWVQKYESGYGKQVERAEAKLENISQRIEMKTKEFTILEGQLTEIQHKVSIREDHLSRLNEQLDNLKKVLTD